MIHAPFLPDHLDKTLEKLVREARYINPELRGNAQDRTIIGCIGPVERWGSPREAVAQWGAALGKTAVF